MSTRRPTRRDLLIVVGRLQNLVGLALQENNDLNPDRQARTDAALHAAHTLCIEARSYDRPIDPTLKPLSPWAPQPNEGHVPLTRETAVAQAARGKVADAVEPGSPRLAPQR